MFQPITLSIIICCHNGQQFIEQCISSLCLNEHPDWEVIFIDDASQDGSLAIISTLCEQYPTLRVIPLEYNIGLGLCRNHGMLQAKGTYISFLDVDDYVCAETFDRLVIQIQYNNADIIITPATRVYESETKVDNIQEEQIDGPSAFCKYLSRYFGTWACWNSVYKRSYLIHNTCLFQARVYYEDSFFCMRAMYRAAKVLVVSDSFYFYRCTNPSITRANPQKLLPLISSLRLHHDIAQFVLMLPPEERFTKAFADACFILVKEHLPRVKDSIDCLKTASPEYLGELQYYLHSHPSPFTREVEKPAKEYLPRVKKPSLGKHTYGNSMQTAIIMLYCPLIKVTSTDSTYQIFKAHPRKFLDRSKHPVNKCINSLIRFFDKK